VETERSMPGDIVRGVKREKRDMVKPQSILWVLTPSHEEREREVYFNRNSLEREPHAATSGFWKRRSSFGGEAGSR